MRSDSAFDRSTSDCPLLACPIRSESAAHSGGCDFRGYYAGEPFYRLFQIGIHHSPGYRWQPQPFRDHMRRQEQKGTCFRFADRRVSLRWVHSLLYRESPCRA